MRKAAGAWRWLRAFIGYGLGAVCIYWSLRDVRFGEFLRLIRHANWWLMGLGVGLQFLTYFCVAWEWQWLLRPVTAISLRKTNQAVLAGRFANDVLPVQLGYLVRAYLVAHWTRKPMTAILPSLLLERLGDGLWLAVGITLLTLFVPLSPGLLRARDILGVIIAGGVVLALVLVFRRRRRPKAAGGKSAWERWGVLRRVRGGFEKIAGGIRQIGSFKVLPFPLFMSVLKLAVQAWSYYAMTCAYGFRFSLLTGMGIFLIAYLGRCVPATPASAGMFQVCSIAGLRTFGVNKTAAASFSLVAFVVTTLPLAVAGFLALAQTGITLKQIRKELSN